MKTSTKYFGLAVRP